jgi:hypothetical protein
MVGGEEGCAAPIAAGEMEGWRRRRRAGRERAAAAESGEGEGGGGEQARGRLGRGVRLGFWAWGRGGGVGVLGGTVGWWEGGFAKVSRGVLVKRHEHQLFASSCGNKVEFEGLCGKV